MKDKKKTIEERKAIEEAFDVILSGGREEPTPERPVVRGDPVEALRDGDELVRGGVAGHYRGLVLATVPERALTERDGEVVARILYAGSYVALWQFISQFSPELDFAQQERIARLALGYIKHVESLKLEPLRLRRDEADVSLVEKTRLIRERLVKVVQQMKTDVGVVPE